MKVIVGGYGEIHLKGANRGFFLRKLENNIKRVLPASVQIIVEDARVIIKNFQDAEKVVDKLKKVFGLKNIWVSEQIEYSGPEDILKFLENIKIQGDFKIKVNRANKKFPIKSPEFSGICGGVILDKNKKAVVNLTNPAKTVEIDIRNNGVAFISLEHYKGIGGLPVGTSGRAVCLISGGIDSPVAAYLAMKRGMAVDFIHFSTPPYTSEMALDKVRTLCKKVCEYGVDSNLYIMPFTKISREIQTICHEEYMITLMRRFMIAIAEKVGIENSADCIITGENLAQVASQTIQGIASNNFVAKQLPILRPLICFDKEEIIHLAKQIDTYETSILPYEDCCTVFVPAHPSIKPKLNHVIKEENKLDFDNLIQTEYNKILCEKLQNSCADL